MNQFRVALVVAAVLVLLAARARAQPSDDTAGAVLDFCAEDTVAASSDASIKKLCAEPEDFRAHLGEALPPSAFRTAGPKVDVCVEVAAINSSGAGGASENLARLTDLCGLGHPASPMTLASVAINIVTGLGEHIVATARADLVDYVTKNLTSKLCKVEPKNPLALGDLFPTTCRLFSDDPEVPVDSLTLSQVKEAFAVDLDDLQVNLQNRAETLIADYLDDHPKLKTGVMVAVAVVAGAREIYKHRREPVHLLDEAVQLILTEATKDPADPSKKRSCDLVSKPKDAPCLAVLTAMIVETLRVEYKNGIARRIPELIERSVKRFCKDHGKGENTDCVIDASYVEKWHPRIRRVIDALLALYDYQNDLAAGGEQVVEGESFPELASRLREVLEAMVALCDDSSADYGNASALYLAMVDAVLAAIAKDFAAVRSAVIRALENPILKKELSDTSKKALTFVVSLAAADDPEDVQSVIAAVAEPAGTYKEKYGREKLYLAVNAFVGPTYAAQWGDNGTEDWAYSHMARFSAPVGIELMPAKLSGKSFNLGLGATLIDPLALAAVDVEDGAVPEDQIAAVLDFGAYLRIGIAKSPVSAVAGFSWRPALRSASGCSGSACYEGAIELFAGFAADVPLLVIR